MKNIIKILKVVMPISPLRMAIYFLLSLPGAVLPAVILYLQRQIVDGVVSFNQGLSMFYYAKPVLLFIATYMVL